MYIFYNPKYVRGALRGMDLGTPIWGLRRPIGGQTATYYMGRPQHGRVAQIFFLLIL